MAETFNECFSAIEAKVKQDLPSVNALKLQGFSKPIYWRPLGEKEIASVIERLDNKHSSGVDHTSNAFVNVFQAAIVPILTMLVNQSIELGVFPSDLKNAKVLQVHKSGTKKEKAIIVLYLYYACLANFLSLRRQCSSRYITTSNYLYSLF